MPATHPTPGPVLVAHASRMGSTAEIAEAIGSRLSAAGLEVDVLPCAARPDVADYDAVVIGSAIYLRRWEKSATDLLRDQAVNLTRRPVWLFQSGPCGEDAATEQAPTPRKVARRILGLGCDEPVTFGGRLAPEHATGPVSTWMASGPPFAGDYRDFSRIRTWADAIADQLTLESEAHR